MAAKKPLEGKRIVITRPGAPGEDLAAAVKSLGGEALTIPAIETVPVSLNSREERRLVEIEGFEWVAFTSVNALEFFFYHLERTGTAFPKTIRVAAVGPATAKACRARGLAVTMTPFVTTGAALAERLAERFPPSSLLLPRSNRGRTELASILKKRGWTVEALVCYETRNASLDSRSVEAMERGVDAALFASPSAVNGFLEGLPALARERFKSCLCVPIGPTTRDELLRRGLRTAEAPARASNEALLKSLLDSLDVAAAAGRDK